MPLTISDEWLAQAGLDEPEARIEIACRLFAVGKLPFPQATRWTGLSRTELENELLKRNLPLVRITEEYLDDETTTLGSWDKR
jgi:predicted HTH domain antitoxin